jgi:3-methyladenine DNA glycosylase AlkD
MNQTNRVDKLLLELQVGDSSKEDQFIRLGLAVPTVRKAVKSNYHLLDLSDYQKIKYLDQVWRNTKYFESMSFVLYSYQYKSLTKTQFNIIVLWINKCTCWEHSDDLSKIYSRVLEDNPEWILPTLLKWNKSKNKWKRRQSVVSLLEYSSKRSKTLSFNKLISFVRPLLADEEYYVQKGVGWTLREIYNIFPLKTILFIEDNLFSLTPVAFSTATEKVSVKLKTNLKFKRKQQRLNI